MFITTIKKSFSATVLDSRQDITNSQFTTLHSIVYTWAKGQGRQSQPLKKKKNLIQCCLLAVVHHSIHSIVQKSKHKMHNTIIQLYKQTCNGETWKYNHNYTILILYWFAFMVH